MERIERGLTSRNNAETIAAFVTGHWHNPDSGRNSVTQHTRGDLHVLQSYATPIAYTVDGTVIFESLVTYSPTTSGHLGDLRYPALSNAGYTRNPARIVALPEELAYGWAHAGTPFVAWEAPGTTMGDTPHVWGSDNGIWRVYPTYGIDYVATVRRNGWVCGVVSRDGTVYAVSGTISDYVRDAARRIATGE